MAASYNSRLISDFDCQLRALCLQFLFAMSGHPLLPRDVCQVKPPSGSCTNTALPATWVITDSFLRKQNCLVLGMRERTKMCFHFRVRKQLHGLTGRISPRGVWMETQWLVYLQSWAFRFKSSKIWNISLMYVKYGDLKLCPVGTELEITACFLTRNFWHIRNEKQQECDVSVLLSRSITEYSL